MKKLWPAGPAMDRIERLLLSALQLFLVLLVALAVLDLFYLLAKGVIEQARHIETVHDLQAMLERGFAGALLVLIGLELLVTVRAYVEETRFRLEVVLVVGIIAIARHVVLLDLEHVDGVSMLGIGSLLLALVAGYYVASRPVPRVGK